MYWMHTLEGINYLNNSLEMRWAKLSWSLLLKVPNLGNSLLVSIRNFLLDLNSFLKICTYSMCIYHPYSYHFWLQLLTVLANMVLLNGWYLLIVGQFTFKIFSFCTTRLPCYWFKIIQVRCYRGYSWVPKYASIYHFLGQGYLGTADTQLCNAS